VHSGATRTAGRDPCTAGWERFERFSRAESARGRGGIGLGLSIVEAIAHAHDGHTYARNRPGGGADVAIVLGHTAPTDSSQPPMVTIEAEHG